MFALSSDYLSDDAITVTPPNGNRGQVTAKLIQNNALCTPGSYMLEAKIIEEDGNKYCALVGTGSVAWEKLDNNWEQYAIIFSNIKITCSNPNHCHWLETVLWVSGSNGYNIPMEYPRNWIKLAWPIGGAAPESKEDVLPGRGGVTTYVAAYWGDREYDDDRQDVVPGDAINCTWYMWNRVIGDEVETVSGGFAYFSTDILTGGRITAVNGEYGSEDITYTVRSEGSYITCVSSDFVEYSVDDWVIIQKSGNLILPLQIGSFIN